MRLEAAGYRIAEARTGSEGFTIATESPPVLIITDYQMPLMSGVEMAKQLRNLAIEHDIKDMRLLETELNDLIEDFAYLDVDESSIAEVSQRLQSIIYKNKMNGQLVTTAMLTKN